MIGAAAGEPNQQTSAAPTVHRFSESLARSQAYADAPWWEELYRSAFPGFKSMASVRDDGWAQRGGIDRVITLASGKTITVDEKVRYSTWPDILLEHWSDEARRVPGWIAEDLACDFIAYAFAPDATCYLLPFLPLRRAWQKHGEAWTARYRIIRANNGSYVTACVAVPISVLYSALVEAMKSSWTPERPQRGWRKPQSARVQRRRCGVLARPSPDDIKRGAIVG